MSFRRKRVANVGKVGIAAASGGAGGALVHVVIGGLGSGAFGGLSVTLLPMIVVGAIIGCVGFGSVKAVEALGGSSRFRKHPIFVRKR